MMLRSLIIFLLAGLVGAIVADGKGRSKIVWFLICFLFPLSILILLVLPSQPARGKLKNCPECGRIIKEDEAACPHCRKEQPINMVTCPSCGFVVRDEKICGNCGAHLR